MLVLGKWIYKVIVMEKVETLKGMIEACKKDIDNLRERLRLCENDLKECYIDLFYAENGMERGQPFMFEGEIYVRVQGGRIDSYVRAYTAGDSEWRNIYRFDYGGIHPLPMEK